jgi:hypothetical protein
MLKIVKQKRKEHPEYSAKFAAYIESVASVENFWELEQENQPV